MVVLNLHPLISWDLEKMLKKYFIQTFFVFEMAWVKIATESCVKRVPWITKWKNNASHQFHNYKNWLWREWVSHWSSFYWYKTKRIEQRNPFNCQFGIIDRQLRFCGSPAVNSILPPFFHSFWLQAGKRHKLILNIFWPAYFIPWGKIFPEVKW